MHRHPLFTTFLLLVISLTGCSQHTLQPSDTVYFPVTLITPQSCSSDDGIPVIIITGEYTDIPTKYASCEVTLKANEGKLFKRIIPLKRGMGSALIPVGSDNDIALSVGASPVLRTVFMASQKEVMYHAGCIDSGEIHWDASIAHIVDDELVIGKDATLIISEGTHISVSSRKDIVVYGKLHVTGTLFNPVVFSSHGTNTSWGGIEVHETTAEFSHCFFIHGGANSAKPFPHANCQPVILADESEVVCESCYFLDNPGKALGGNRGRIKMESCYIARCTSGGEFLSSSVMINQCHICDIPNDDGIFIDNDNDGFYFYNYHPEYPEPSRITHTTIITGKDDAIDHNTARLIVDHCWLEDFMHEGIAASEAETLRVSNTVIRNCEQGVEAGYGSPSVFVNHCVIVDNDVGIRFGDSYDIGCSGAITAENSVIYNNGNDVCNLDLKTGVPFEDGIRITHSIIRNGHGASVNYCINKPPLFDEQYYLTAESPGINAGNDRCDMGLVRNRTASKTVIPHAHPFSYRYQVVFYD